MNVVAIILYLIDFDPRPNNFSFQTDGWRMAFGLEVGPLLILASSGGVGGQLAYVHHVGVVEESREVSESEQRRAATSIHEIHRNRWPGERSSGRSTFCAPP